jgi:predicted molibdopterin-dependent oxidoreductase YjgC
VGGKALGAIFSAHLTNEENFRFGQLLRAVGAGRTAMAVRHGKADNFLIKAEKAANARGVRELELVRGGDDGLEDLLKAAESGEVKGLYVCGDDVLDNVEPERMRRVLDRLELLIVQVLKLPPEFQRAAIVFPTTTFAEKDGTFTNYAGRVQRIQRAIETPPGWLGDGEVFSRLLNMLDSNQARTFDLPAVWNAIARECPAFSLVSFDGIGAVGMPLTEAGGEVAETQRRSVD